MKQKNQKNKKTCKITKPNRLKQITTSGILKNMILIRVKLTNNTKEILEKRFGIRKIFGKNIQKINVTNVVYLLQTLVIYIVFSLGNV